MCQTYTGAANSKPWLALLAVSAVAFGQTAPEAVRPDWRKIGSTSVDLQLASPATGAVDAVWFSPDGRTLYARTHAGRVFETVDSENWVASTASAPRTDNSVSIAVERLPMANSVLRSSPADPRRVYALGAHVY